MLTLRTATATAVVLVLTVAVAVVALVTGTTDAQVRGSATPTTPTTTPTATRDARPRFTDCRDEFNLGAVAFPSGRAAKLTFECADVSVPLDYARPTGRTITVAVVRVHSSGGVARKRSLLVNPGGPGASGVSLAVSLSAQLNDDVLAHFDLIGFDPRGVGQSTPIRCLSDKQKDALNAASPDIRIPSQFAAAQRDAREVAQQCSAKYGSALAQFDTVNTARDMDAVRIAVGATSMNFLGFSYGTELGGQYARLFPSKVGAIVLDGAVNPSSDAVASFADQLQGFENAFDQFAGYCNDTSPCNKLGDARAAVDQLVAKADDSSIPSSRSDETRRATSSLIHLGILQALYSRKLWPVLADALRAGLAGDSRGLLALADQYNQRTNGRYSNIIDANTTIGCNDAAPGPSDATIRTTASNWAQEFPIFGLWSAPSLFDCQQWQPVRTPVPSPVAKTSANTILVVGNVNDPATPYAGAKQLTKTLGHARLLTWDGEGHTSYLQGSECIDADVNAYLLEGTLPAKGTTCRT